jgi:hypothetical protein
LVCERAIVLILFIKLYSYEYMARSDFFQEQKSFNKMQEAPFLHNLQKKSKEDDSMDIKEISGALTPPALIQKKESGTASEFQKIFQEVQAQSPSDARGLAGLPGVAQGFEIGTVNGVLAIQDLQPLQARGIAATENTLALLEQYQQALADPAQTLKEINPLVQALSEKVTDLQGLARTLAPADPLKKIIQEVGTLSAVEVEKFNRGEYV